MDSINRSEGTDEDNAEDIEDFEDLEDNIEESSVHSSLLSSPRTPDRRCSARLLSKSVAMTLRQLQKEEHNARVAELVRSNEIFYRKQQICETFTILILIGSFTGFSIYLVLAHGFHYFYTSNFTMVYQSPANLSREGGQVELMCRTDHSWEWCRWVHMDTFCEWEWISAKDGVKGTGCNMDGVELTGNYSNHECGIRFTVLSKHEGEWLCEIEKYHPGFSRRYGEVLYGQMTLSVIELYSQKTTTETSTTTQEPTTHSKIPVNTSPPLERSELEKEEYERQFFILKIIVRSGVVLTLISLAGVFGALFWHSWRAWDQNMVKPNKLITEHTNDNPNNQEYPDMDPALLKRIKQNRRKSVAFSVCVLDRDSMTFEMDRKKVFLTSSDRIAPNSFCPLPTLQEDCETEKVTVPLSLVARDKIRQQTFNRARRMSMPPGPLTEGILNVGEADETGILKLKKFRDSTETII